MPEATTHTGTTASWSGTAVVAEHGEVVHEESQGFADGPGTTPCGPHLRFQASSISKQFLSVVALALQQRNVLQLDRPITRWLTDLPHAFDDVALHHLLTHTAGTGHWADLPGSATGEAGAPLVSPPDPEALRALTAEAGLTTPAGAAWRYSGPGCFLAAQVLEAATGDRYRDLVVELVVEPAAMTSTTSGEFPLGRPDVAAGHRAGHRVHVDPGWTRIPGSGDLWTTAADLVAYSRALRSGQVLHPDTAALLWTSHVPLPAPPSAAPTQAVGYGYGTFVGRVRGRPAWFVPGDNPGYQSLLAHLPGSGTDLVVLCNDEVPGVDTGLGLVPLP